MMVNRICFYNKQQRHDAWAGKYVYIRSVIIFFYPQKFNILKRKKFVSIISFGFIGSLFFAAKEEQPAIMATACDDPITPPVAEGPFYKDEKLNRGDITESKKGTPVEYLFKVEDEHCKPIQGAIVDIWQCDHEGVYSDFKAENTVNETWLRGYQVTDKNGMCRFKSIFPGWYEGRITHLHAKVHVQNKTVLTTNFFSRERWKMRFTKTIIYYILSRTSRNQTGNGVTYRSNGTAYSKI